MNAPDPINRPIGLVRGMPFEDYLAVDALSASAMRLLARSPWHYRNRVPMKRTRPMLCGSLVHCAQLEPEALAARYAVVPDSAPRRPSASQWGAKKPSPESQAAMAWWRDYEAECKGRTIIPAEDYAITEQQIAAIQAEPYLRDLFANGESEVSVFWIDKATGVYCKARPDFMQINKGELRVVELKSTQDESPDGFARTLSNLGYHRARAHYIDGIEAATGLKVAEYVFAVVSSAPPVLAVPYWLDEEDAQQGADECAELRERFAWCQRENQWPAYGTGPQLVGLKPWAKRNNELEVSFVND
jgi:hypothetical protein